MDREALAAGERNSRDAPVDQPVSDVVEIGLPSGGSTS
jgi:hypothetical protein